jgi:HK97 gp10 family phage protein
MPLDLGVTVQVKGLRELQQRLATLPIEIGRKALRKSVAAGASVIRAAAKARAPISKGPVRRGNGRPLTPPGTLKRAALIKYVKAESTDTQASYIVAFRKGKRAQKTNKDAFYASWVEFGHKIVPRRGKSARRGTLARNRRGAAASVPPHPYFRPAWESTKSQALIAIETKLAAELKKLGA